jgi:RHS repeat-associated protein
MARRRKLSIGVDIVNRIRIATLLCAVFLTIAGAAASAQDLYQVETRPPRGFMPNMDQLSSPVDHIDPVSRKLHVEIPLASLPPGRGGSGFDLNLVYDSTIWDLLPESLPPGPNDPPFTPPKPGHRLQLSPQANASGWNLNIRNLGIDFETRVWPDPYSPQCSLGPHRQYRLRVRLMDGSLHLMHLKGYGFELQDGYSGDGFFSIDFTGSRFCWNGQDTSWGQVYSGWLTYYSDDGSYLKLEKHTNQTEWYLYFPDGRRVIFDYSTGQQHHYDANGNGVHFTNECFDPPTCNQPYQAIRDDAGHEIRIVESWSPNITTITTAGPNGPISWTLNWELLQLGLDGRRYTRALDTVSWDTTWWYPQLYILKYVQLPLAPPVPPGQSPPVWNSYAFSYADDAEDGYGQLDEIRLPTGAAFRYRYTLEGSPNSIRAASIAGVNVNGLEGVTVRERRIVQTGESDLVWTYVSGLPLAGKTTVTNPNGSQMVYWYWAAGDYLDSSIPYNSSVGPVVYRIEESQGRVVKRLWSQNRTYPGITAYNHVQNSWVKRETVTVGNSSGVPTLTAVTDRTIDKNGNVSQTIEYEWVGFNPSGPEAGSSVRRTKQFTYYAEVPNYSSAADDPEAYWNAHFSPLLLGQPRRLDALRRKETRDGVGAIAAVTEFDYDDPYRSGNVTAEKRWDSVKSPSPPGLGSLNSSNSQVLTRSYGAYGNLEDIYAPEVRTHITYDSSGSFPTRVDYAYQTSAQRSWTYDWNATSGTLLSKTDLDNNVTTSFGYDTVGRPTIVNEAGLRKTETIYDDANRKVTIKKDLVTFGDGKLQVTTEYDQLGRVSLTRTSEPGNPDGIKVKSTYYPTLNRTIQSSPYRSTADPTLEWTCTQTDASKRVTAIAVFRGSAEPTDCESTDNRTGITRTVYDSNWIWVTDPASKVRGEGRDALGNLVQVLEDPSGLYYQTFYAYDALGNLTNVTQGVQSRAFQYSSLGRLLSATNPESGTIAYTYNDSGNLLTRTDARGIVASFSYDPLHRIQTKSYSDGTPTASYTYYLSGAGSPKVGQLQSVSSAAAWSQNDSYDALGRVTSSSHTVSGDPITRNFIYTYWLNNGVKTVTNPSGRVIQYDVDDAGRTAKVYAGSTIYADMTVTSTPYTADGRIAQMKLGNNLWETRVYQTPGSPTLFRLGTTQGNNDKLELEYNFSSSANNGNLQSHVIRQPGGTWTQTYSYDGVNRLLAASEAGGWSRSYGYDQYGNRWVSGSSGLQWADVHEPTASSNFNPANNRLSVAGSSFDAAGNQIYFAPWNLGYDAENRAVTVSSGSDGNAIYAYDGDGRRVKKTWTPQGGTPVTTYYVYNALGQLAAEYSTQSPTASTAYIHTDMLGSTRMVTNASGATLECYDYLPFGRMLSDGVNSRNTGCYPPNPDAQITSKLPQKFTGKERDETKLDFFGARDYSGAQGRFTSPDKPFADQHPEDPQSWNLYGYVRNNPLAHIDPTGEACSALLRNTGSGFCQRADLYVNLDLLVHSKTRFFAAASATSQALANVAVPGLGRAGASADTAAFLESTGQALQRVNIEAAGKMLSSQMSGEVLDRAMVHKEQNAVQKQLDAFKATNPEAYGTAIKEINSLLNSKGTATNFLGGLGSFVFPTDKAYFEFLGGVRKTLGHDINFANQKDREAIGNALIKRIRERGGCDVAGDEISGCPR